MSTTAVCFAHFASLACCVDCHSHSPDDTPWEGGEFCAINSHCYLGCPPSPCPIAACYALQVTPHWHVLLCCPILFACVLCRHIQLGIGVYRGVPKQGSQSSIRDKDVPPQQYVTCTCPCLVYTCLHTFCACNFVCGVLGNQSMQMARSAWTFCRANGAPFMMSRQC